MPKPTTTSVSPPQTRQTRPSHRKLTKKPFNSTRNMPQPTTTSASPCANQGQLDQAIENYRKSHSNRPGICQLAYNNLGLALSYQGQLDQAIENYQKAIQFDPEDATPTTTSATPCPTKVPTRPSHRKLPKSHSIRPGKCPAYNKPRQKEPSKLKQGQLDQAIENFHKAIQIRPGRCHRLLQPRQRPERPRTTRPSHRKLPKSHSFRAGRCHPPTTTSATPSDQGQLDQAIENYQKAIQFPEPGKMPKTTKKPFNYPEPQLTTTRRPPKQGQLDQAIENYQKPSNRPGRCSYAYYTSASPSKGQLDQAIENYQKAIQFDPENAAAYYNLGSPSDQGQLDQAIENYQKAIQIDPEYATAYFNLGCAYLTKASSPKPKPPLKRAFNSTSMRNSST